jgi:hypothetical protein
MQVVNVVMPVYSLFFWDKFITHNSATVEAMNVLSAFERTCLAFIRCGYDRAIPPRRLWLGFWVVLVHPCPSTCGYLWNELWVTFRYLLKFLANVNKILLPLSWQVIWHIYRLDCKMYWTDPNKFPSMLPTSWIDIPLFLRATSFTWSRFSSVFLFDRCPECASPTAMSLLLNLEHN